MNAAAAAAAGRNRGVISYIYLAAAAACLNVTSHTPSLSVSNACRLKVRANGAAVDQTRLVLEPQRREHNLAHLSPRLDTVAMWQ